jgi:hypothetical protein
VSLAEFATYDPSFFAAGFLAVVFLAVVLAVVVFFAAVAVLFFVAVVFLAAAVFLVAGFRAAVGFAGEVFVCDVFRVPAGCVGPAASSVERRAVGAVGAGAGAGAGRPSHAGRLPIAQASGFCAWCRCSGPASTCSFLIIARPRRFFGSIPRIAFSTAKAGR